MTPSFQSSGKTMTFQNGESKTSQEKEDEGNRVNESKDDEKERGRERKGREKK